MMYVPSMPYISSIFNTSYTNIVYTFTAYVLGYGLAMLFGGGLSDLYGRKNSYLITISIFGISSILIIFTTSIYTFILLRLIQGLGGGGCAVVGRSSVRDVCEGRQLIRGMSFISMTFNVSMGFFQFLGGLSQTYLSYKANFIFMFCFSAALFILVLMQNVNDIIPSKNKISFHKFISNYASIMKEKRLLTLATAAGFGYSILLVFNILGIFYLQSTLHISADTIGLIGVYFSISYLLGGIVLNFLVHYFELNQLIKTGSWIIFLSSLLGVCFVLIKMNAFYFVLFPALLGVFGHAILYPSLMSQAVAPYKSLAGSANSLFGFTQQITGFIVATIAGWLPHDSIYSLNIMLLLIVISVISLNYKTVVIKVSG